jgi:medium-chain acyl-[acyl-carrier-protein] hydrolase
MYVEQKFFVGLQDIGMENKITNKAILGFLEDSGGIHSNIAGYGLKNIKETKLSWIILNWKLKVFKRANYAEMITVRTWSSKTDKLYAYRDFEVLNEDGEIIAVASSKWVAVNIETEKIIRLTEEIVGPYKEEHRYMFPDYKYEKIIEPETILQSSSYTINRQMIDINKHVHNIYYYDLAEIAIPEEVLDSKEFSEVEINYKKEIKFGETVKCNYSVVDDEIIVTIKSEDESATHAIIKLK